jgi:tetratricopeptide (TPR) repeat protein
MDCRQFRRRVQLSVLDVRCHLPRSGTGDCGTTTRPIALALLVVVTTVACCFGQAKSKRLVSVDPESVQVFDRQPKVALLIAVGAYPGASGFGPLLYPARDLAGMRRELEKQGYTIRSLVDSEATRGVIRKTLRELVEILDREQGTFIFYFSGHGFEQDGANYLAAYGSVADDLKGEGLSLGEIFEALEKIPARRKMLFIDACRNNPIVGRQASGQRSFASLAASEGVRVLYSTRPGGLSWEDDDLRQGVFSHFLINGLHGEAAGRDGLVTFADLSAYVTESVRSFSVKKGQAQVPFEAGQASGEFLLGRARAKEPDTNVTAINEVLMSAEASAKEGLEFVARGRYREAITAFTRAIESRPAVAEEYYYRGLAYGHVQEHQRAVDDFSKSLDLGGDSAVVYGNRGYAYAGLNRHEQAIQDFNRALELKPDYAAALVSRGRSYAATSQFKRAVIDYDKALELQPGLGAAHRSRGTAYAALGSFDLAMKDLARAIELEPNAPGNYLDRGNVYLAQQQQEKAISDYGRAIQLKPDYAAAHQQLARAYIQVGDFTKALDSYSRLIELEPGLATAYANRAYAYAALRQFPPAIADCNKALKLQPNLAEGFNNRGYAYLGLKEYGAAIKDFDQAILLVPDYASALENRADARKALGDGSGAKADRDKARELRTLGRTATLQDGRR